MLPPLSTVEYAELREDIAAHGVQVAVIVDETGRVIDGHHRQRIARQLGVPCPSTIVTGHADDELRDMSLRLNLHRRHLTGEQKRAALAASIKADPELSDRQHADRVGTSHPTASAVRRDLQAAGDVEKLATRTDSTGRQQPATRPVVMSPAEARALTDQVRDGLAEVDGIISNFLDRGASPLLLVGALTAALCEAPDSVRSLARGLWQPRIEELVRLSTVDGAR